MLTTSELGAYLAAVGNHEAKALTYLAMEPGEPYGVGALHRLFMAIQGEDPVFTGVVNLQQKYCLYSFELAGLVRRAENDNGRMRHIKDDDRDVAAALAGHLLATTMDHDASLAQIFGKTAAPGSAGQASQRPPIRRFAVLRAMAMGPDKAYTADVARRAGVRDLTVGHIAAALAAVGVLGYHTEPTYRKKSSYRVDGLISPPTGRHSRPLVDTVVTLINARLTGQSESTLVISRDEIEAHLREQPPWAGRLALRDSLQKVMVRLAASGQITPVRDYTGHSQHSTISVTSQQREFLQFLVAGIEEIAAGDPQALEHWQDTAEEIVHDPVRVRRLLGKAFGTSKLVVNPITETDKQRRVLDLLSAHDGLTTEEITERLHPDLNTPLVRSTLAQLAREHRVRGDKQADGPYKRWFLS